MPFRPTVNDKITINRKTYTFIEHPSAKGMPYGQTGRRATVYQVRDEQGQLHALKVFTKTFRTHLTEDGAKRIEQFAHIPGLQVCSRTVITTQGNSALLKQYPDLEYAVLMQWVAGQTWQEIILSRQAFSAEESLTLARNFAGILAAMENAGIAHCDLSGPNVLVNGTEVALVDVEDLYAPGLEQPEKLSSGSAGYGHKTAKNGLWGADADRFAGAILLAEMLGWHDQRVRRIAVGEQYFDAKELQTPCDRYVLLQKSLQGAAVDLFVQAWNSASLAKCPTFADWAEVLGSTVAEIAPAVDALPAALTDLTRPLYESVQRQMQAGNWEQAVTEAKALQLLAPNVPEVAQVLARAEQAWEDAKEKALKEQREQLAQERAQLQARLRAIDAAEKGVKDTNPGENELRFVLVALFLVIMLGGSLFVFNGQAMFSVFGTSTPTATLTPTSTPTFTPTLTPTLTLTPLPPSQTPSPTISPTATLSLAVVTVINNLNSNRDIYVDGILIGRGVPPGGSIQTLLPYGVHRFRACRIANFICQPGSYYENDFEIIKTPFTVKLGN